ncbi:MAG: MlaD family protein [Litorilituus sp.]|jgi:paraquat-inducible protein B|nr:MlaD family protein [Litorilituus sp.]
MTKHSDPMLKDSNSEQVQLEVVPRQGISIVWFVPIIALIFGLWLAIKIFSEQGVFITIEFENGAGIVPKKTQIQYKGLVTGVVKSVEPSEDLQNVIAEVEISKTFADYLTDKTHFWLVSADISLQGVSGLDTLISGSYINILPDRSKTGEKQDHFIALNEPPELDMSTPGLHLTLQTSVLGSISENSPINFKQIPIGYVTGYHYVEENQAIDVNVFIEQEYAHLVKENSLFWNTSGVQLTASIASGIKVNTDSLASMIAGGIAVDTLSYQEKGVSAKNGQKFPLHADFQAAEMGHEIELTFDWNAGIDNNATILYQGLTIGTIESIAKIDPKVRKITARAKVNPRVVPYLTEQSQFYLVSPRIDLTGIANAKTLLTGTHISLRPSLQGKPTDKFNVFNTKPPYKYTEPGLHLVLQSHNRHSLQVGSLIFYKEQRVGNVQAIETANAGEHLVHIHIKPEYQHYVAKSSHFYNNSGVSIKANLQGLDIKAHSLQSMLTGGISFENITNEKTEEPAVNGDIFNLFANQALAQQRASFVLLTHAEKVIKKHTRVIYRGEEIGAVNRIEKQGSQQIIRVGILPQYQHVLRENTQFWLAKAQLSLSGITDTDALFGGDYITFNIGEGNEKSAFPLLEQAPAKPASAKGLQLSLFSDHASVASSGSVVSYRGIAVGQVDNVELDKLSDKIRINITIDESHQDLIKANTRFYNASGVTLAGGISDFVVKTESVDAILRGGISFYNPNTKSQAMKAVKEQESFHLFEHFELAQNSGLAIEIHFNDFSGLKINTQLIYQEQEVGKVSRLVFHEDKVGVTAMVLLNDLGAKYAKQGSQFWVVEPEIGLVGSKNISSLIDGAFIAVQPSIKANSAQKVEFEALELAPTIKQLPYGLNIKLTAQRLGSVRVGNPVLYRQVKVGEVIGIDLSDTADTVDVFVNIAKRYAPLVNQGSKFWNTSGINIEAGIFSGVNIDSESIETLIAGGIAFATPEQTELKSQEQAMHFTLYQDPDSDWLDWQTKITIGQ